MLRTSIKPSSLPPAIKLGPSERDELAALGAAIDDGGEEIIADLVCTAAERLAIEPDQVVLVIAMLWLTDQIPEIANADQRARYERQFVDIVAGKPEPTPLSQYASSIEGMLAVPILRRIQEWDVKQNEGAN